LPIDPYIKRNIDAIYEAAAIVNDEKTSEAAKAAAGEVILSAGLGLLAQFLDDIHKIANRPSTAGFTMKP
jgi:hypothetical protein